MFENEDIDQAMKYLSQRFIKQCYNGEIIENRNLNNLETKIDKDSIVNLGVDNKEDLIFACAYKIEPSEEFAKNFKKKVFNECCNFISEHILDNVKPLDIKTVKELIKFKNETQLKDDELEITDKDFYYKLLEYKAVYNELRLDYTYFESFIKSKPIADISVSYEKPINKDSSEKSIYIKDLGNIFAKKATYDMQNYYALENAIILGQFSPDLDKEYYILLFFSPGETLTCLNKEETEKINKTYEEDLLTLQEMFIKKYYDEYSKIDKDNFLKTTNIGSYKDDICSIFLTDEKTLLMSNWYKVRVPKNFVEEFENNSFDCLISRINYIEYLPFLYRNSFSYDPDTKAFIYSDYRIVLDKGLPDLDEKADIIGAILIHKNIPGFRYQYFILVFTDSGKEIEEFPEIKH